MPEPQHHIGNLHLRAASADEHAGPRIAEHLSGALAELPAPRRDTTLASLRLRVRVAANASEPELARAIALALSTALR